jgi:hypothetical protein
LLVTDVLVCSEQKINRCFLGHGQQIAVGQPVPTSRPGGYDSVGAERTSYALGGILLRMLRNLRNAYTLTADTDRLARLDQLEAAAQ